MATIRLGRDYLKNLSTYLRHDDFLDGTPDAVRKYLVRHLSEQSRQPVKTPGGTDTTYGAIAWNIRNERLANDNLCEPILSYWLSYLSQEIDTGDQDGPLSQEPWTTIFEDMDGDNTPLDIFVRQLLWWYPGYGQVGVLCEGPETVAGNKQGARDSDERSYAQIYEPWTILKAEYFRGVGKKRGKLKEVLLWVGDGEGDGNRRTMLCRRYWIEKAGHNYQAQDLIIKDHVVDKTNGTTGSLIGNSTFGGELQCDLVGEVKTGAFDEIPFVVIGKGPRLDSVIYTGVHDNKEHLNKKSARDTIDYYQAFQRVWAAGVEEDEAKQWAENILMIAKSPDANFGVIESGNPESLKEDLENIERKAFLRGLMRVALMHQMTTRQVQSADSKREDNATFEKYLGYIIDVANRSLKEIITFLWRFEMGDAEPDFNIAINKDFRIAFTEQELAEQALMVSWAHEFGPAGRKLRSAILRTKFSEQRIIGADKDDEDALKKMILSELWEEAQKEPAATNLRDSVARNRDVVGPDGPLDVASAIENGVGPSNDAAAPNA